MLLIHAIKSAVRVDGTPAGRRVMLAIECAFPTAAATAAETSFSAAQRCTSLTETI